MSAASIQARVKTQLARAIVITGSSAPVPVYRVRSIQSGDPITPVVTTTTQLLPNAIFKSYGKGLADTSIRVGDRQLVSDSDNVIEQNDIIRQGSTDYIVIAVDERSPASDPLLFISQVRKQ